MPQKRQVWLSLALLCSACMYFYRSRLPRDSDVTPAPVASIRAKSLTDLFQPWFGSRELLLHHRDPYGPDVTREIQTAFFGRELKLSPAGDLNRAPTFALAYRFAYPLYIVFFLAPTIGMEFRSAQVVVWWFLAAVTAWSVLLWVRAGRIRLSVIALIALFAVVMTSLPVMQGLDLRQPGLLVAVLLAAAAAAAVSGRLFLSGSLLALATIKPQLAMLPIVWFGLWVSGEWRQRRSMVWGFATMLAFLVISAACFLPDWPVRFLDALRAYAAYSGGSSYVGMFLPAAMQWWVCALGAWVTASFCWRARESGADSVSFTLALALVLNLSVLIMPTVIAPYNHVLLLPAGLLVIGHWKELWAGTIVTRIFAAFCCALAILPWPLAVFFTLGRVVSEGGSPTLRTVPAYAGLGLPFAGFGLLYLLRRIVEPPSKWISVRPDSDNSKLQESTIFKDQSCG
jgi:hypothetical protein